MSSRPLPRVFNVLASEKDPAVDEALRAAIPHLEPGAQEAALQMLCDRGRPEVLARLLIDSTRVSGTLQQSIFACFDRLHPGLRFGLQSEVFEDRAAVIAATVQVKDYKSLYLLGEAVQRPCPRTRELAARGIRQLVEAHLERRSKGVRAEEAAEFHSCQKRLAEVLQVLVANWEQHHQMELLEAALWMADIIEETLSKEIERVPSRLAPVLEHILKEAQDPRLAGFVLRALGYANLRSSAAGAISEAKNRQFMEALFEESWLLLDHRIRHGFRPSAQFPWPSFTSLDEGCADAGSGLVRMAAHSGGGPEGVAERLSRLVDSGGSASRLAFWQLIRNETPHASQALELIAARAGDPRSRIAQREVRRRQRRNGGAAQAKRRNVSPSAVDQALDLFLEEHNQLGTSDRNQLADELRSLGPQVVQYLKRALQDSQSSRRLAALHGLSTLKLVQELVPEICRCAYDPDVSVRCAALKTLGEAKAPASDRLLREALQDPHPRVQATAIETLEHQGVLPHSNTIHEKLDSKHNRVRANAIKALWKSDLRRAASELEKMLIDDSPQHRMSALWVVERLRPAEIAERLAAMSSDDPDDRVRTRARRLMGSFRLGMQKAKIG